MNAHTFFFHKNIVRHNVTDMLNYKMRKTHLLVLLLYFYVLHDRKREKLSIYLCNTNNICIKIDAIEFLAKKTKK